MNRPYAPQIQSGNAARGNQRIFQQTVRKPFVLR